MPEETALVAQFVPTAEAGWRCGYEAGKVRYLVYYDDAPGWVPYPPGADTWVPARFQVEAESVGSAALPYRARLQFVVDDGRPVCTELALQPHVLDLTSEGLRKLSVSRLLRNAALAAVHKSPDPAGASKHALEVGEWAKLYASEETSHRLPTRRLDDDHYRRISAIYQDALMAGTDPVRAVEAREFCSRSTAGRWVGEARARGFLAKTTTGKPSPVETKEMSGRPGERG